MLAVPDFIPPENGTAEVRNAEDYQLCSYKILEELTARAARVRERAANAFDNLRRDGKLIRRGLLVCRALKVRDIELLQRQDLCVNDG